MRAISAREGICGGCDAWLPVRNETGYHGRMLNVRATLPMTLAMLGVFAAASTAQAITRDEILSRAREWVQAGLLYCGTTYGKYDSACSYTCNRQENPAWDPYRSDCSGMVSWAWGLPPPGPDTKGFAPYGGSQSFVIAPADLQPGDALNDRTTTASGLHHHIMLFAGWDQPGIARIIQESNCTKPASEAPKVAQIVGDRLQVGQSLYWPIRYVEVTGSCQSHCEGSIIVNASCGKGDCAAYGATCITDSLGVRCVYTQCPPTGTVDVCLDQDHLATCTDGLPAAPGDCSAYAAFCSTAGGNAHCASYFCAAPNEQPIAHTTCFIDGSILHCDTKGVGTTDACPSDTKCSVYPSPHCDADNGCPATGDVRLCLQGRAVRCYEGTLAEAVDCPAQGLACGVVNGLAICLEQSTTDEPDGGANSETGAEGGTGEESGTGADGWPVGDSGTAVDSGSDGGNGTPGWRSEGKASGCACRVLPGSKGERAMGWAGAAVGLLVLAHGTRAPWRRTERSRARDRRRVRG